MPGHPGKPISPWKRHKRQSNGEETIRECTDNKQSSTNNKKKEAL